MPQAWRGSRFLFGFCFSVTTIGLALFLSLPVLGPSGAKHEQAPEVLTASSNNEPAKTEAPMTQVATHPLHENIITTVFWVGEAPSNDNGRISNHQTEWDPDPVKRLGYTDSPDLARLPSGHPVGRSPNHNDFYCALPLGEYNENGLVKAEREASYWADQASSLNDGQSLFKGRWVKVMHGDKTAFLQVLDTGPFSWSDRSYVWGSAKPSNALGEKAGIDISPAAATFLGVDGSSKIHWQFVDQAQVEHGPWLDFPAIDNLHYW